jgi:multidrug efflux pump subunit AcrA (membrane-fusion protein)
MTLEQIKAEMESGVYSAELLLRKAIAAAEQAEAQLNNARVIPMESLVDQLLFIERIAKLAEVELRDWRSAYWCFAGAKKRIAELEAEQEVLVWNLAGCSTYAAGHGLDGGHDKNMARPALDDVLKMAQALAAEQAAHLATQRALCWADDRLKVATYEESFEKYSRQLHAARSAVAKKSQP